MRKRNNRGSTLILALVFMVVLMTLGGAILMVLNTNYKVRVKEGRRLQNLYKSEAGLDVTYNILAKNFEAGVKSGVDAVDNIDKNELEKLNTTKEKGEYINKVFKENFKSTLTAIEIKKTIDNTKYINDYTKIPNEEAYKSIEFNTKKTDKKLKVECKSVDISNKKYEIKVESQFEEESSTGNNLRKIEIVYELKIPNYEDAIAVEGNANVVYPEELKDKIIGVDGNLNVDNAGSLKLDMKGDIFVKGSPENDKSNFNKIYDKYNGGVRFDTQSSVHLILNGDIITANTFNISNTKGTKDPAIEMSISGNVYAKNVYIGGKDGKYGLSNLTNITGETIVDNDLAMKGNKTKFNTQKFYGINDKTIDNKDVINSNYEIESRNSSSIIVNGSNESSINIKEEAYIMGTAYINAQNKQGNSYQTGESVAIKGNYIAYTKPMEDFKEYDFDIYGPLQMIDSYNGEKLDVIEKSEYFKEFATRNKEYIKSGSVKLPIGNTYSIGAIVYENNNQLVVERSNYNENTLDFIKEKRKKYAQEVYCMGSENIDEDLYNIYEKYGKYQKTVSDSVDFSKMKDSIDDDIVLNSDENKTIVLTDNSSYKAKPNEIVVKVAPNRSLNMLILTKGDVKVVTNLIRTYKGSIISAGNISFDSWNGSGETIMEYDENVVQNIVKKHADKLQGVFKSQNNLNDTSIYLESNEKATIINNYDVKRYLTSKNWKIIK